MPSSIDYKCRNCGNEFHLEVLTSDEAQKARDKGEYVGPIACPRCRRTDLIQRKAA